MKRRYDAEFKRNAVQKVFNGQSVASVSKQIGVNESLIFKWKRIALDEGDGVKTGAELANQAALKKRNRELEQEVEILKKGGTHLRSRKVKRFQFIDEGRVTYSLKLLCRVMKVSASGYYAWRKRLTGPPKMRRKNLAKLVKDYFFENRRRCGTRRIKASLNRNGIKIGRYRVRNLIREQSLEAIVAKKFKPRTTDSRGTIASPNLLKKLKLLMLRIF